MTNWSRIKTARAVTPSASDTSALSSIVANVDPNAMVTTKSKAFIFVNVRLPDTRNSAINAT